VFANAIDLTFDLSTKNVIFAAGYLSNAGVLSNNMKDLYDPSPVGLNGTSGAGGTPEFVAANSTVGVRFGFSTTYANDIVNGVLFRANQGSTNYLGLRKVGSDYVYYKGATSGQVDLHVSNETMSYVSWYGSLAFSLWIGGTLPTEAQWEFAARRTANGTGDTACDNKQYSGSDALNDVGWNRLNNISSENIHEVGTKASTEIGLYDMSGNQWEWCADCINNASTGTTTRVYYPNYKKGLIAPTGADLTGTENESTDPIWNPTNGSGRVRRGGGYNDIAGALSLAFRDGYNPADVYAGIGFRPILVPY
jgi:formylglycine-generating enzyme required for sulfatase activity